ncbi:MAG TPA: TetR/AcrR family transcriptional regulator [Myxococcales bacterium]|nr:TetR/AcrR family transcriptional regulator [Myxococcales bacterium]HIM00369.1 TetR/AcrR family transcriptional regulator [Myxococcales bacterium]
MPGVPTQTKPTRTRLPPEARRSQLLDAARTLIVERGMQAFTMEALARAAEVSNPLVYKYFASRADLLGELVDREYRRYRDQMRVDLERADNFEDIVRVFVAANFDHHARGNILPVLLSQPELAATIHEQEKRGNRQVAKFLVGGMADTYRLTRSEAEYLVSVASGTSIGAANFGRGVASRRAETIESTLRFIFAGIKNYVDSD